MKLIKFENDTFGISKRGWFGWKYLNISIFLYRKGGLELWQYMSEIPPYISQYQVSENQLNQALELFKLSKKQRRYGSFRIKEEIPYVSKTD